MGSHRLTGFWAILVSMSRLTQSPLRKCLTTAPMGGTCGGGGG